MSSAKIKKSLKNKDLANAFSLLKNRIDSVGSFDLKEDYNNAINTYRAMLSYMLQGVVDEHYNARHEEIVRTLFSINDQVDRLERINNTNRTSFYSSTYKQIAQKTNLSNIAQRLAVDLSESEYEAEMCNLYNYVWTSSNWSKGDYEVSLELINSKDIRINAKVLLVSAVTLALFEMFDDKKLEFLFDSYLSESNLINQRALVGIILVVRMYNSRLECYPEIISRLKMYSEDPHFVKEMYHAIMCLQMSSITDKISTKLQNELFPTLLKKAETDIKSEAAILKEMTENGENPEWALDKKYEKSMNMLIKMQTEGADIYLSTFRYMKGYPFFSKMPHWFYLFDSNSPFLSEISALLSNEAKLFLNTVTKNGAFCDNDLYSFILMLSTINKGTSDMLNSAILSHVSEEDMAMLKESCNDKKISNESACRLYIFNLYRFFFCSSYSNQIDNPFKAKKKESDGTEHNLTFSPLETSAFSFMLDYREELQSLAEFFMRKGFYEEALAMYSYVNPLEIEEDASIWQKIGFCKQKMGKEKAALKTYMLADNLLPNSNWTMTHIAQLALKLEKFDVALNYFDLLLLQDENNLKFIINKAFCQIQLELFDDAITTLYKADYIDENSIKTKCMMIEAFIKSKKLDRAAEKISSVVIDDECPVDVKIINALLSFAFDPMDVVYYSISEALAYFKEKNTDARTFESHYNNVLNEYADYIGIDKNKALMLLDSVNMEIR